MGTIPDLVWAGGLHVRRSELGAARSWAPDGATVCHRFTDVAELNRVARGIEIRARDQTDFVADLRTVRLGALAVDHVRASPLTALGTPARVAGSGPVLQLGMVRSGFLRLRQDDRSEDLGAGQGGLLRWDAPYRIACQLPVDIFSVLIPFPALGALTGRLAEFTARPLPPTALSRLTLRMLEQVGTHPPDPNTAAARCIERTLTELVKALIAELAGDPPASGADTDGARLRVRDHILGRLGEPDLGPAQIAADIHVSTRYLHRLFENENTTVAAFIRSARLAAAARMLTDAASSHLSVAQVARMNGFAGSSQFARCFRARFGVSPSEMRGRADQAPEATEQAAGGSVRNLEAADRPLVGAT